MEIIVDLGDIGKAIDQLETYKKDFDEKVTKIVKRVVKVGEEEARGKFSIAIYDGINDVRVSSRIYKKTGTITARGKSVLFIEFGTGLVSNNPRDIPTDVYPYSYLPGSWSEGPEGKGHWDNPNGWYYAHGKRSLGNPANKCMYDAYKAIATRAADIAKVILK